MAQVTIGAGGSSTYYVVSGLEILGARPAMTGVALAPERFVRPIWSPPRSFEVRPVAFFGPAPSGTGRSTGITCLPERQARPAWNPGAARGGVVAPVLPIASAVVVPRDPVPPVLPASFLRPAWNPERSLTSYPFASAPTVAFATLAAPAQVTVNVPFTVTCTVTNPTSKRVALKQVVPEWFPDDNEPGTFGQPYLVSAASLPPDVTQYLGSGFIYLRPGQQVTFAVGVVLYVAGGAQLQAAVEFADGSERLAGPVTVVAVRI